jgi:translocation and assembly module TamA
VVGAFALTISGIRPAFAADPQPYTVTIEDSGIAGLNDVLQASSQLVGLKDKAPAGPFALIARARDDIGRFQTVLESYGYYQGRIAISIDHQSLDAPNLADVLDGVPTGTTVPVDVSIKPGALYYLRRISIKGAVPPGVDTAQALGVAEGQPAIASKVVAGTTRLLTALQEQGYALATVSEPIASEDDKAHVLDVSISVDAGPRVLIGEIAVKGLHDVNEEFVRRALRVHTGQLYQPSKIEAARQALLAFGVFSGVSVNTGKHLDSAGRIPLVFEIQERPKHAVAFSGAYSTDLGVSLSASWSDRNVLGNAEQLNLSAAGTGLGGTATTALGYNLTAQFIEPMFLARRQDLELDLTGIKQAFLAYNQTAETVSGFLRRKLSAEWKASIGLSLTQERIEQEGITADYQLVALPLSATLDSTGLTDLLQDPTQGFRASLAVTPTHSFGRAGSTFVIMVGTASTYFDFSDTGRTVVAVRALMGSALGTSQFGLPPDQRLYAGGSGTIRGYKYQTVGPLFADGNPQGGLSFDAAAIELRQRLFENFGAAAFVDAGQDSADAEPFSSPLRVGLGAGVRYYTPIGAVRLDVAVPVTRIPQSDAFELYVGLGQAF